MRKFLLLICTGLLLIELTACTEPAPPVNFDQPAPTPSMTSTPVKIQTQPDEPTASFAMPDHPANFAAYPAALVDYLNAAPRNIANLAALLESWGAYDEEHSGIWKADLDADGATEYLVAYVDPADEMTITVPSMALIIDRAEEWRAHALSAAPLLENFTLLELRDFTANGHSEIAYSTITCGAHTCFTRIEIAAWDGQQVHSLTDGAIDIPYLDDWEFTDRDADEPPELRVHGGIIGSIGAGPQRASTVIYEWNGKAYNLAESVPDDSPFLYFKVLDANAAMGEGDYETAIKLYRQAITDRELVTWHGQILSEEAGAQERADLTAFAQFRLVVIYAAQGDLPTAQEKAAQIPPAHIYAQVTRVFLEAYQRTADMNAACAKVTEFAAENDAVYMWLNDFGYANPTFAAEDVCPNNE